jgi:RHS repeat-associated protein
MLVTGCDYRDDENNTRGVWSGGIAVAENLGGSGAPKNPAGGISPVNPVASNPGTGCPGSGDAAPGSDSAPSCVVADPVNVATGNQFEAESDFAADPHTGLGLTRYYNSQDTMSSQFGQNWHSTWHRGLTINGNVVTVTRADGRQDIFTNNGSGVFTADADVTSTFAQITDANGALTGWQLTLADDTVETYLVGGQLASITTRAGLVTTLSYDNSGNNVTRVTGPFGHVMSFAYDASNHVTTMTAPDGTVYTYTYDANNNLTSVTYPDGTKRQYLYENATAGSIATVGIASAPGNELTGIVDENGARFATFTYDAQGRSVSTQHAGGAELTTVAYNSDGSSTVTDANGNSRTYSFTTQFGLLKATALTGAPVPSAGGRAFSYDANGFLASRTDYDGNVMTFTHDVRGNETSRTEASGTPLARSFSFMWHPTFHLPTQITEPTGRTTTFTYDASGNMLTRTVTAGSQSRTWSFTYNAQGQVLTKTDPRGNVTSFTYDARGDIATVTDALGHTTRYTSYDGAGRLLSMTDPNGLVITRTYDARGRLTSRALGAEKTILAYDAAGNRTGVTLPDGSFRVFAYDAAHRLTGQRDALGNGLSFTLDGNDNRTAVGVFDPTDTIVQKRSFAYDSVNRVAAEIGAQNQETDYSYDPQGNLTQVSDPLNHRTGFAYDQLNRRVQTNDPAGGITGFGFDALDRLIAERDPRGLTTGYGYDGLDDQTGIASPDTGNTVKTFDAAGNLLTSTDARGKTTTYSYDPLNRMTRASYADGTSSTYQYDQGTNGIGHLTRMVDPAGTTTFAYDQHGRLTSKTQVTNSVTLVTRMAYDTAGRLASITYPSGNIVSMQYDAYGQLKALSQGNQSLISNVLYRPYGPPQSWHQGNGGNFTRSFDLDGRITSIGMGGAATVTYAYDAANRITGIAETGQAGQAFGYDALDRLTGFASGTTQTNYGYDADGNRLNLSTPASAIAQVYAYAANSNQLLSLIDTDATKPNKPDVTQLAFTYDAAGNTLSDGTNLFTYNARGRMASVTGAPNNPNNNGNPNPNKGKNNNAQPQQPGQTTQYAINGLGQRIVKSGNQSTEYVFDGAGHLLGEYDDKGNVIEETVWLGDLPLATIDASGPHYINPDHLGAPHIITDNAQRVLWSWVHAPFGDTQPITSKNFSYNLRFPGQIFDAESGLNYNMMRDYNSALGRYVQSDPIGLFAGVNTYGYVGQNPVTRVDRNGEFWPELIAIPIVLTGFFEAVYYDYYVLSHTQLPLVPAQPHQTDLNACTLSNPTGQFLNPNSPQLVNYAPMPEGIEPPEGDVPEFPERTKIPAWTPGASYPMLPLPQPWSGR